MIWEDSQFQKYASEKFNEKYPKYAPYAPSEALAKNYLYRACKLTLASELKNIDQNKTFQKIMRAYCSNPDIPL